MHWKSIRLELAQTPDFPHGSVSRAYLLRVPLDGEGNIDGEELEKSPELATIRRFWPSERDVRGYLVPLGEGWGFSPVPAEPDRKEGRFHLASAPLQLGANVTLKEPDGRTLPFRVASVRETARI
jgi:hypothetical protein